MNISCRKSALLMFVFFNFFIDAGAQYQPGSMANGMLPNASQSAPDVAALGKFGAWPVSLYTGTVAVSIPIYNIKIGGFELPVKLDYHSGGVKVEEMAGWTGVNWTLNAGGMISRTIVGKEDEDEPNGLLYRSQRNIFLKSTYNPASTASDEDYIFLQNVARGNLDSEPDIFFYNFAGKSGRFYFDANGNMQCTPVNNLKLLHSPIHNTFIYNGENSWRIADEEGNIYHFSENGQGIVESMTHASGELPTPELKITGYYLTKIVLHNRFDTIYFEYGNHGSVYDMPFTYSFKKLLNSDLTNPFIHERDELHAGKLLYNGSPSGVRRRSISSGNYRLTKIRWSGGYIEFTAGLQRQDMNSVNLTKVSVYNSRNERVREMDLGMDYISGRYFLTSVTEKGSDASVSQQYLMEYDSPASLPDRFSCAVDHWGYFNAQSTNSHLLPQHVNSMDEPVLNAKREPNQDAMLRGSLKKITYPTGGSTEFIYQANYYDPMGVPGGGNPYGELQEVISYASAHYPQTPGSPTVSEINVSGAQVVQAKIEFRNYGKPPSPSQGWWPKCRIEKQTSTGWQSVAAWDAFANFPSSPVPNPDGTVSWDVNTSVTLQYGTYRLVTELVCNMLDCDPMPVMPSVKLEVKYQKYVETSPGQTGPAIAGGLRISEIINRENGKVAGRKKYTYSPGKILIYPRYLHEYEVDEWKKTTCYANPNCRSQYLCWSLLARYREVISSGQTLLGFTQGSPVGYANVREAELDATGTENGYVYHNFTFVADEPNVKQYDDGYWGPNGSVMDKSAPQTSNEHKRGLPSSKLTYKIQNGTPVLVHQVDYEYQYNDGNTTNRYNSTKALRVKRLRFIDYPCGVFTGGVILPDHVERTRDVAYTFYDVRTSWIQSIKTIESTWDENGLNPITKQTDFTYNNPSHLQATSVIQTDSKGKTVRYEMKYPADFATPATPNVYDHMITRNLVSAVIQEKKDITAPAVSPISTTKKNFATFHAGNVLAPSMIQQVYGGAAPVEGNASQAIATVHQYDAFGRVVEFEGRDGIRQSIIWGSDRSQPMANCAGAGIAEVAFTSFEDADKGGWTMSGAFIPDASALSGQQSYSLGSGAITKSGLTAAKRYIVSYWTKNTAPLAIAGTQQGFPVKGTTANGWTYYQHVVSGITQVSVLGTGSIDQLLCYPEDAKVTSYTYKPLIGITSSHAANGMFSIYEYDTFQRLKLIRDYSGKIVKQFDYQYQTAVQ